MKNYYLILLLTSLFFSCNIYQEEETLSEEEINDKVEDIFGEEQNIEEYNELIEDESPVSFSSVSYGEVHAFKGNDTWLYHLKKSQHYNLEFKHPEDEADYTFYYAKDETWQFIGDLPSFIIKTNAPSRSDFSVSLYFKEGYRVAYTTNDDMEPIEISFNHKKWKVN